jgi:peptidoglycan/xylan/chitin deacetylase (PgdA/CDA1 family)
VSRRFRVALTFDAEHPDRPNDGLGAGRVLAALDDAGVPATFFLQGRWVQANPRVARRIAEAGHQIGSHSHYHARMPLFSLPGFDTDVHAAEAAIRRATGVDPRPWFRLPFGSGATHVNLILRLARLGYRHVGWHAEIKEWRARETAGSVRDRILARTRAHGDGAIVLLHTWPDPVGNALASAIEGLASAGATFVRVDQLDLPPDLDPVGEPRPADASS